ncbi:MAG: hypothetical protein ABW185_17385 [Sedimenticola sp.]
MLSQRNFQVAANIDCSHLCNNKLCVNAGHLSFEPRAVNNARKYCFGEGVCVGHESYPDCMVNLFVW